MHVESSHGQGCTAAIAPQDPSFECSPADGATTLPFTPGDFGTPPAQARFYTAPVY